MRQRINRGIIGGQQLITSSSASGINTVVDAQQNSGASTWPQPVTTDPYFMYVPLLLNTTSTNAAQNNTFLDSSSNAFTITRNGTPTQGAFTPYQPSGYWSNYLNQSSAYLTFPLVTLGSTFTAEGWFYPTNPSASVSIIASNFVQDTGTNWIGYYSTKLTFSYAGIVRDFATTITANTWYHFAFVVTGSTVTCYLNGTQIGTTQSAPTSFTLDTISRYGSSGIVGYLSNFRVVNGVAVYTGTFTPSTSPLQKTQSSGTNISAITGSQTSLLTCQSNRFIDNSNGAIAITPGGTPLIQAFQPFSPAASYAAATYGGSGYFNGSSYLTIASNAVFTLGTNNHTVEFWSYHTTRGLYDCLWQYSNGSSFAAQVYYLQVGTDGSGGYLLLGNGAGGWGVFLTFTPPSLNVWHHYAIVRNGNIFTVYIDGVSAGTATYSGSIGAQTTASSIGASAIGGEKYTGYIANFRFVNGTAVYTSNFTPPTTPLTAISNTQLLTNFANAGIYDAAWQNNALTVGDAQVSTTQYKWGTTSMKFDGTGDWLYFPSQSTNAFGNANFTLECWIYIASPNDSPIYESRTGNATDGFTLTALNSTTIRIFTTSALITGTIANYSSTWTYVAVARSGSTTTLYVNGVSVGTTTSLGNLTNTDYVVGGGRYAGSSTITASFNGYIQDFRITKGIARTITTPTAAFPTR